MLSRYNKDEETKGGAFMNVEEVIKKAESDEGLTVKEIKVYQKAVKPV